MILTSQQLYDFHNATHDPDQSIPLIVPLSYEGWNIIAELLTDFPKLTVPELIEKALAIAYDADSKEFA